MSKEKPSETEEFVRLDWRLTGEGEIPCEVSLGMFFSERTVTITCEETLFQFDMEKDFVKTQKEPEKGEKILGFVRVAVNQEKESSLVVVVPGEPAGNHSTYIEIPKNLIRGIKVPKKLIYPDK